METYICRKIDSEESLKSIYYMNTYRPYDLFFLLVSITHVYCSE